MNETPELTLLPPLNWKDYDLLDTGNGLKLERYGPYRLIRPEPEAIWRPALAEKEWESAQAVFKPSAEENGGHWEYRQKLPERWMMNYGDLKFWTQTTASRHVGVFPEQGGEWDWMANQIRTAGRPLQVLNLFGYTGLATLAAAQAGASVTHVDASRKVVNWASENLALSGLKDKPVRWIVDDALKFVQREGRRGSGYDGIILDPPKFGRGPKGEVWEFYKLIPNLLQACYGALGPDPKFVIMTAYAVKASAVTLYYGLKDLMKAHKGSVQAGEVVLREKSADRILSMAVYACWFSNR
ncbi:MAG: class I SAM-dependent methyltransferase [Anaerolineae bacterium]|nr:class I SAM-dependent methyltransferase [Anaerolineae bacterium]